MEANGTDGGSALFFGVSYNFIGNSFVLSKSRTWMKVLDPVDDLFFLLYRVAFSSFLMTDLSIHRI
jgi:hypothetical protein